MNKGFILIPVLIFIFVLSILSLATIRELKSALKSEQAISLGIDQMNKEIIFAKNLRKLDFKKCISEHIDTRDMLSRSSQWWEENSCKYGDYYLIAEDLKINPCAMIKNKVAQFFRITVVTAPKAVQDIKSFVQVIDAERTQTTKKCHGTVFHIKDGIQRMIEL